MGMSTPTPEAESLKDRGNELFARGKYGAAIDAYTNALDLCPRWIVPLVNRALMYRHKRDWANVRADCERALSIDREHMKANYYLSLAMIGEGDHPDAARRLNKALESARTQVASIQTEIWRMYALAKYYDWAAAAAKRKARYDAIEAKLAAACGVEAPSKTGGTKNGGSGAFDDPMDLTMDDNAYNDSDVDEATAATAARAIESTTNSASCHWALSRPETAVAAAAMAAPAAMAKKDSHRAGVHITLYIIQMSKHVSLIS